MRRRIILAAALAAAVAGAPPALGRPTDDAIREYIKPYHYKCDSLDGNYIIAEEIRYAFNNVDSAYSVYIVYDMHGNVAVPLGGKSLEELGWEGYVRPHTFRDVYASYAEEAHWARGDIWSLAAYGVADGYPGGYFYPDKPITRAEFLKLLANIVKEKYTVPAAASTAFPDVNNAGWHAGYIAWAADSGIIKGYPDGNFYPDNMITREEMALTAYNAVKALALSFPRAEAAEAVIFSDDAQIADWCRDAVNHLSGLSFINGDEDRRFSPKKAAARAEAVTMAANMYYAMYEPNDRWLP